AYARSLGKESHAGIMAGLSQTALTCIDQWVADRNFDTAIGGLLGAALDALAAAKSGSDAQLHLANLVLALTSRTARCSAGGSAVALGRSFASQVLAVPVGEEIDRMYPGAPSEAADDGGGAEHSAGALPFRGLINDHTLRWNALTALVCLGWADQTDIARETQSDPSSSGRLRAETASAALPLPIVKIRAWEVIREAGSLSNDVLSAVISGFIASSALPLIEGYVDEYFAGLLGFCTDNSIEIARRLVLGLYPRWSVDEGAVGEPTDARLAPRDDAPAARRRLMIERADDLARAICLASTRSARPCAAGGCRRPSAACARARPAPERAEGTPVSDDCPVPGLTSRRPVPANGAPAFWIALHPPPTGQRIRRAPENSLPVSHFFQSVT